MTLKEAMTYRGENEETLAKALDTRPLDVRRWCKPGGLLKLNAARLQQLAEALDAASQGLPYTAESAAACASFMQVSGLSYTVDLTQEYDKGEAYGDNWCKAASLRRVTITDVNGQPFDAEAIYAVITSNAYINGMDASYIFPEAVETYEKSAVTTAVVRDVVWQYIAEALHNVIGEDYAAPQGRITLTNAQ